MIVSVIALALTGCAKEEAPVTPTPVTPTPVKPTPVTPTPAAPEVIKWKFTAYVPSAMATFGYDEWTCKTIGELSGGRLVVEAFPAGAIVGAMEAFRNGWRNNSKLFRIIENVVVLLFIAIMILVLAAAVEVYFTPILFG